MQVTHIDVPNIPHDSSSGSHAVPLDRTIYIDQSDFREVMNTFNSHSHQEFIFTGNYYYCLFLFADNGGWLSQVGTNSVSGIKTCWSCH